MSLIKCEACKASFDERAVVFGEIRRTTEACPYCDAVLRSQDASTAVRFGAIVQEDVTAIDQWLEAVSREAKLEIENDRSTEANGHYAWSISGAATEFEGRV